METNGVKIFEYIVVKERDDIDGCHTYTTIERETESYQTAVDEFVKLCEEDYSNMCYYKILKTDLDDIIFSPVPHKKLIDGELNVRTNVRYYEIKNWKDFPELIELKNDIEKEEKERLHREYCNDTYGMTPKEWSNYVTEAITEEDKEYIKNANDDFFKSFGL